MYYAKLVGKLILEYWERAVFVTLGLVFFTYSILMISIENIPSAAVVFGLGFLSFIYANVSRFKKFKGLGFEAELWEDKKREAADLVERLKKIVSIYTEEVVLIRVRQGRYDNGPEWKSIWKLFDQLTEQHDKLGQRIDFTQLKKKMDGYFLFNMTIPALQSITEAIRSAKSVAQEKVGVEFGNPIRDAKGFSDRHSVLNEVKHEIHDALQVSTEDNLAQEALELLQQAHRKLARDFDIKLEVEDEIRGRLSELSELYKNRPVTVTDELIVLVEKH